MHITIFEILNSHAVTRVLHAVIPFYLNLLLLYPYLVHLATEH